MESDLLKSISQKLAASGIDSARTEARMLIAHARRSNNHPPLEGGSINSERSGEFSGRGRSGGVGAKPLPGSLRSPTLPQGKGGFEEQLESYIQRRLRHEPIAYITGHREFWSLDFEVGPGVLIPRPDTETLVEQALKAFPDKNAPLRVLDLGTGSGAIPIAFLSERPQAKGLGVEQSPEAMIWARKNIARHNMADRLALQGDDWLMLANGAFDVIFSNPPYIESHVIPTLDPDVRDYEPRAALDGGRDGLDAYRAIAPIIAANLATDGGAFVEIGQGQEQKVPKIFAAAGLETVAVVPDLGGIVRCVIAAPGSNRGKKALERRL